LLHAVVCSHVDMAQAVPKVGERTRSQYLMGERQKRAARPDLGGPALGASSLYGTSLLSVSPG
jgi:hypothetical protein